MSRLSEWRESRQNEAEKNGTWPFLNDRARRFWNALNAIDLIIPLTLIALALIAWLVSKT